MSSAVRIVALLFVVTLAHAGHLGDSYGYDHEYASSYDNYEPHNYQFDYSVSDPHTGDHKSQYEVKQNGVVRGFYSLVEPDGTTRVVEYIADEHGFRADVKKIGQAIHDQPHHHDVSTISHDDVPTISHHHNLYEEGYKGVYDGQAHNYDGIVLHHPEELHYTQALASEEPAIEEGEHKVVEPISYSSHATLHPETLHAPLIYISKPHVHVTSEVHGLTGNPEDDSSYTNYGDNDHHGIDVGHSGGEWQGSFNHEGAPEILSWAPIPYKTLSHYLQPTSYQSYQQHGGY